MPTKWEINVAVRTSGLPAPSRLIILILSDLADANTGVIPDDRTPSLRELAEWTGLGKGPIATHLNLLEERGWVIRVVPPIDLARREHARTKYSLAVGNAVDSADRRARGRHARPAEPGHVPNGDMPSPERGHAAEHVPAEDMACPEEGHAHVPSGDMGMSLVGTVPYTDEEGTIKNSSSSENASKPKRRSSKTKDTDRPDVERVCQHLADRLVANGCKRPNINQEWRDAARRLIDLDGRTEEQIIRCIDWATSDEFWHKNILSMPTLRKQYDRLRLDAEAQRRRANGRASPHRLTEVNGLMLGEANIANLERAERIKRLQAAKDAGQLSIEGHAA